MADQSTSLKDQIEQNDKVELSLEPANFENNFNLKNLYNLTVAIVGRVRHIIVYVPDNTNPADYAISFCNRVGSIRFINITPFVVFNLDKYESIEEFSKILP